MPWCQHKHNTPVSVCTPSISVAFYIVHERCKQFRRFVKFLGIIFSQDPVISRLPKKPKSFIRMYFVHYVLKVPVVH